MNRLDSVEKIQLRKNVPEFQPGDTVRVHVRIKESETKERLQAFEGVVIARKHGGVRAGGDHRTLNWSADRDMGSQRLLRIAIDAHSVGTQLAGNESYAVNLVEALAEIDSTNNYTLYVTKRSAVERFSGRWPNFSVSRTLPHTPIVRIPVTLSAELRRNPVDVLHVQFTAPPLVPCPFVVSIHDLSFEHLPLTFKRRSRMQLRLTVRRTARKAARVLALSESARQDIIETYDNLPERVTAIQIGRAHV